MWDVLLDALIDSAKVLGVLVVLNILIALAEGKATDLLFRKKKYTTLVAVGLAVLPQCGFSVLATDLYQKRKLTAGALIGVYIATSDEALPILIAEPTKAFAILPLIAIKVLVGVGCAFLIDTIFKEKLQSAPVNPKHGRIFGLHSHNHFRFRNSDVHEDIIFIGNQQRQNGTPNADLSATSSTSDGKPLTPSPSQVISEEIPLSEANPQVPHEVQISERHLDELSSEELICEEIVDEHHENFDDEHHEDFGDEHHSISGDEHHEDFDDEHHEDFDDEHHEDFGDEHHSISGDELQGNIDDKHHEDFDDEHHEDFGDEHHEEIGAGVGCCKHHIGTGGARTKKDAVKAYLVHPLIHSLKIFAYVLVINIIFGIIIYYVGEDKLIGFLETNKYLAPLFGVFVGIIPNCAASVILTDMYVLGGIGFGTCIGGLTANAGLGLLLLFKKKADLKRNLVIIALLLAIAITVGYVTSLFDWFVFI